MDFFHFSICYQHFNRKVNWRRSKNLKWKKHRYVITSLTKINSKKFLLFLVSILSEYTKWIVEYIAYEITFITTCYTWCGAIWKFKKGWLWQLIRERLVTEIWILCKNLSSLLSLLTCLCDFQPKNFVVWKLNLATFCGKKNPLLRVFVFTMYVPTQDILEHVSSTYIFQLL